MCVNWSLEEEGTNTLVDRYSDRQDDPGTWGQVPRCRDETNVAKICKGYPVKRGLVACSGDHSRLAEKDSTRSTAVEVSNDTHGCRCHIEDGRRCRCRGRSRLRGRGRNGCRFWRWSGFWCRSGRR